MAHRLVEEHAEVLPLYGGGVLKLINHHMLQLGTDLLENERRVAVADEGVKQLLGVAEEEAVGVLVQFVYLLFDAAQQAELTEVSQGEVGTFEEPPLTGPLVKGLSQQTVEGAVGQGMDEFTARMGLLIPFRRVAHAVGDTLAYDALVEQSLTEFEEETAKSRLAVGEIVDAEPL